MANYFKIKHGFVSTGNGSITGTLDVSAGININGDAVATQAWVNSLGLITSGSVSSNYLPLSGGTLTGTLTLSAVNPRIDFNGTSDSSVDMAIVATPEGLDFIEPEQGNRIQFQIKDDAGVNAPYGYAWNGQSLDDRYAAAAHTHAYNTLTGIPNTFTPSAHTHPIDEVDGLQAELDGKQPVGNYLTSLPSHNHDDRYYTETESDARFVKLSGSTMGGDVTWTSTGRGLQWTMNTDGAYIRFYNTGDSDTNSRLEYGTTDNGNEYHRFMVAGTERMKITASGITATGYNKSNWDTAYGWGNHAGLYDTSGSASNAESAANIYTDTRISEDVVPLIPTNNNQLTNGAGYITAVTDDRNTRGVSRLYRRDGGDNYSIQHHWTGSHWYIRGYTGDSFHAEARVGAADNLTTARNIALSGAVTGNANFDGSGNITIATTATSDPTLTLAGDATGSATFTNLGNATLTVTVANDSHTHDGRYYTESESDARFVNVTGDTITGDLFISGASLGVTSTSQGTEAFYVDGVNGRLFTISDDLSDSLFSVNTISGLPVIEAFADNTVKIGPFSNPVTIDSSGVLAIGGVTAATETYVDTAITNLIGGAPGALDTLNELAAAINDNASYASSVTTALGLKAPLASPALTGTPTAPTAAASTNSTQIATTAFVKAQGYITSPDGGNAQTLDGIDSTGFLRSNQNDTFTGYLIGNRTDENLRISGIRGQAKGSQSGEYIHLYERVHIGGPGGWGAASHGAPSYGLSVWGSVNFGMNGSGVIQLDDTTIVNSSRELVNVTNTNWDTAYNWGNHAAAGYADASHNHDGRYYTETESDARFFSKAGGQILRTAHPAGTSNYTMELYSEDTGDSSNELSIRFHQGGVYWAQLRYRGGGFRFTGGADDDLTTVMANFQGDLTGNVTGNVSGSAGSVAWSGVTGTPTTLAGYGITDASGTDTNYYLSGASFNTGNGVLTLTVTGASNVTVDLDGRFALGSDLAAVNDRIDNEVFPAIPTPAINSNGSTPSLASGITASEIRSLINAEENNTTLPLSGGTLSGDIKVLYNDHAGGAGYDTQLYIGKSDTLGLQGSFPTYVPAGSYGFFSHASSDGVFFGSVPVSAGASNYYATIAWGDDATEYLQFLYKGDQKAYLTTDGHFHIDGNFYASGGNSTQWNTAYGWGDHASAGYMVQPQWVQPITSGFGFHDDLGSAGDLNWAIGATDRGGIGQPGQNAFIIEKRTDGVEFTGLAQGTEVFTLDDSGNLGLSNNAPTERLDVSGNVRASGTITASGGNSGQWNTAYGWGDHAAAGYQPAGTYNTIIGTDSDINTSGATIIDNIYVTDGVITSMGTRTLTQADLGIPTNASGNWWNGGYAAVGTDGVMEVGKYIDFHDTDTQSSDFSYRITNTGGRLYFSGDLELDGGDLYLNDGNTRLHEAGGNALKVSTNSGYIELGPMNTGHCHIQTDRTNFYFNTQIQVDTGKVSSYNEDLYLQRAGSTKITVGSSVVTFANHITVPQPAPPTFGAANIVGETIEVVFDQSPTSGVDSYQVWSSAAGGSYGLVANIPTQDIAATMTAIDAAFSVSGAHAYRVYAIKNGVYSEPAEGGVTFNAGALDVVNMSVVNLNSAYYIQYDMPDSRFVDHIEIYMDAEANSANLTRTGATLVYSGNNTSYMYQIASGDMDKFHQFWVEVVES